MSENSNQQILQRGTGVLWYQIEELLGRGGFGITYLATDLNLRRKVAMKEYFPSTVAERAPDSEVRPISEDTTSDFAWGLQRFTQEAQILATIRHPNIVQVYNVFELNHTAYMVMEYETGESLEEHVKTRRLESENEALRIFGPVLDGLEYLHERNLLHRDLKPANIFLRDDLTPVLLDFGSAREALLDRTSSLTRVVSGGFSPYEQYVEHGPTQGPWTDIYSLGATIYASLNYGRSPVSAMTRGNARIEGRDDPILSSQSLGVTGFSDGFHRAVDQALEFLPKDRPQSILEWRRLFPTEPATQAKAKPISHPARTEAGRAAVDPSAETVVPGRVELADLALRHPKPHGPTRHTPPAYGRVLPRSKFLVPGLLSCWTYTALIFWSTLVRHLTIVQAHLIYIANATDLSQPVRETFVKLIERKLQIGPAVRTITITGYALTAVTLLSWFLFSTAHGPVWITNVTVWQLAAISLSAVFYANTVLFCVAVTRSLKAAEELGVELIEICALSNSRQAAKYSDEHVHKWNKNDSQLSLFLLSSLVLVAAPALAMYHAAGNFEHSRRVPEWLILVIPILFLFGAAVFHVWGIRFLVGHYNGHLRFARQHLNAAVQPDESAIDRQHS